MTARHGLLGCCLGLLALLAVAAPGQAATRFGRCPHKVKVFKCATVTVPLDRGGHTPGTIGLRVERLHRTRGPRRGTLIVLAGGPGEGLTTGDGEVEQLLGQAAPGYNVIAVDQRGTGASGALSCKALAVPEPEGPGSFEQEVAQGADCAGELGPRRNFYTTLDSVEDLEAVRRALGIQRWALMGGVSYGTYVAASYVRRYPDRVDQLMLDSVVAPGDLDAYTRSTFEAVPRVLRELCAAPSCDGITADPVGDVAQLVARLHGAPLRGFLVRPSGKRRARSIGGAEDPSALFNILLEGDFEPALRAGFPGAVRSALAGDPAPLLRLQARLQASAEPEPPRQFSTALFAATSCAESRFPWSSGDSETQRRAAIASGAQAIPAGTLAPFDRDTAKQSELLGLCLRWPGSPLSIPSTDPLPNLPTLVLDGRADLRTPLEDARAVADGLPRSHLIAVPNQGHSVLLGQDCALQAFTRFAVHRAFKPTCGDVTPEVEVQPVAPTSVAGLPQGAGVPGLRGRTLTAVADSLNDAAFSFLLGTGGEVVRFGGLRGGRGRIGFGFFSLPMALNRFSYVPGVELSGRLRLGRGISGRLRVGGTAAARGTLVLRQNGSVRGRLGGARVRAQLGSARALATAAQEARDQPKAPRPPLGLP